MLSDQRQLQMSDRILREGEASIAELAAVFGVSTETVRRDLNVICADGRIKKVHGGAMAVRSGISREPDRATREKKNVREKLAIAKAAARHISDNDIIALDCGTCMEALAQEIYHVHNLCVITASLPVASILSQKRQAGEFDGRVILLGGTLSDTGETTFGAETVASLSRYFIDKVFVGATAVSADGLMTWEENEGILTSAFLARARRSYVLAESDKLDGRSFYRAATPDEFDVLITDTLHPMSRQMQQAMQNANVTVTFAETEGITK